MKILIVDDKRGTAIDILANFIRNGNRQHEIEIMQFHPKRPDADSIQFLKDHINDFDIVHWMYWRSWEKAKELGITTKKKQIISHFNPYDITKYQWDKEVDQNIACTQHQKDALPYAKLIRLAVNTELWEYEPNSHRTVGVCANRIESKKGIKEIGELCKKLDITLIVMGRISDPIYWEEVKATGADIEFYEDVPFDEMPDIYHKMGVYIVNSVDNFETGPMPPFEALLCGTPVVSRKVGTIGEVAEDGKNILFFDGKEQMEEAILEVLDNHILRDKIREEGWRMAKNASNVRYAREYNKVYHKTLYPNQKLVSVICPYTPERKDTIKETLISLHEQTYRNIEVISLVDDEEGYNLAKVRNLAITEASGEFLLFLDDRWKLANPFAVESFVKQLNNREKVFLWGDKGSGKRNFVENFSFCRRDSFIKSGMWNERINHYGGMSQEIRARLNSQGWEFKFCEKALAKEKMSSRGKWRGKKEIIKAKDVLYKLGL